MQEDNEFRQVAELLAEVVDRASASGSDNSKEGLVIRGWLSAMVESNAELTSLLTEELERAFQI